MFFAWRKCDASSLAAGLACLAGIIGRRDLLMFDRLRAVGAITDRTYATALNLLAKNRSAPDGLPTALFAAGYLDRAEIEAVLARTPLLKQTPTEPQNPQ